MDKKEGEDVVENNKGTEVVESSDKPKKEVSAAIGKMIDAVKTMTVLELSEFVTALEDEFGVSAAIPTVAAGPAAPSAGEAEEKTTFSVILKAVGDKKIPVIKAIRAVTSLGLKEAKGVADGAPGPVKEGVSQEEADQAKKILEEAGATVELE